MFKAVQRVTTRSALLCATLLAASLLSGCQSTAARYGNAAEEAAFKRFFAQLQVAMNRHMLAANHEGAVGVKNLRVTFNRQSEVINCMAEPATGRWVQIMPSARQQRDGARLVRLVNQECWKMIYPVIPEHLFTADGTVEFIAPLVFTPVRASAAASQERRLLAQAQSDYWRQRLLIDRPVQSIGVAGFRYRADAQGRVQGCLVSLDPQPIRAAEFSFDDALQAQLAAQCKTMDLRQMPGFAPDDHGVAQGYVQIEYAPWKVGRR